MFFFQSDLQPLEILDLIQRVSGIPPSRIQIGHVRCLLAMLDNTQSILWSSLGKPFRHSWEYYLAKHQRAVVRGICTTLTSVAGAHRCQCVCCGAQFVLVRVLCYTNCACTWLVSDVRGPFMYPWLSLTPCSSLYIARAYTLAALPTRAR